MEIRLTTSKKERRYVVKKISYMALIGFVGSVVINAGCSDEAFDADNLFSAGAAGAAGNGGSGGNNAGTGGSTAGSSGKGGAAGKGGSSGKGGSGGKAGSSGKGGSSPGGSGGAAGSGGKGDPCGGLCSPDTTCDVDTGKCVGKGGMGGNAGSGGAMAGSAGSGGSVAGSGGSSAGAGGNVAGSGGAGTGGSTAGTGGSTAGSAGNAGSGGSVAGSGGAGGSGGSPTCVPVTPVANAVTYDCVPGCLKMIVNKLGQTKIAESSANDSTCQTLPFITHPGPGDNLYTWVEAGDMDAMKATSIGSYPMTCKVKCKPTPNVGTAPNHAEMEAEIFSAGYTTVACGSNPEISLSQSCANGASLLVQYLENKHTTKSRVAKASAHGKAQADQRNARDEHYTFVRSSSLQHPQSGLCARSPGADFIAWGSSSCKKTHQLFKNPLMTPHLKSATRG